MDIGDSAGGDGAGKGGVNLGAADLTALLISNFNLSYNGNRSPYGVYVHTPWFTPDNVQAVNDFLSYALALPDVWVVTARQVIEWMQVWGGGRGGAGRGGALHVRMCGWKGVKGQAGLL